MALTPKKREALKLARDLIATEKRRFICYALGDVARSRKDLNRACWELRHHIERQLQPVCTLGNWQVIKGLGRRSEAQRRRDRLAWIDWMLGD